jgi:hypothetical protein
MPNHLFTFVGEGRVHCHGEPPLSLLVLDTSGEEAQVYDCPDETAECCMFEPTWDEGTVEVVCSNPEGEGGWTVVNVPEPGFMLAVMAGVLVLVALARWGR